ncbi:phage replisome organizer N-terminal domain-containing protein [Clostridium botulinum]|uniref:phage replisome organizer N-terminal domain-containing protein n=1 Tax=Clostridium botulinum TaxID=1491 RepID=UPI001C9A67D4|nr:phage replisome organizer N-terminal domain-containing protein [Clostridium botulinum]MBY6809323.1 phage replisome organizer N-terminal domain-containing protein [Clostridium botulinum]MBY6822765.1 phage replisome organizer N-terminal domain-containing protein [Clostridium botulinum]MBY6833377.1 phage replisome organizer N-terminal domain-containing protein [Clostridium botulinum]MBY6971438.1 phage replisome organizer N-terminal domain-containing protein [Clostridium botulinum]
MADIKWIKITTNMFEDEKIRLIDAMPERDTIHYVWIRLLVQAGKTNSNGFIFLGENIPYTDEMLSTIFCRPLTSIRLALKTLKDFRMIEVDEDNLIKIINWEKHQNVEGMERVREQNKIRAKNFRDKKKQLKEPVKVNENEEIEILDCNGDKSVQNSEEVNSNVTELKSNVMQNKNNVTVTKENKRESKNQNKKKIKNKRESKKKTEEENKDKSENNSENASKVKNNEIDDKNLEDNNFDSSKSRNKNNKFSDKNLEDKSKNFENDDFLKEQISFKDELEEANNKDSQVRKDCEVKPVAGNKKAIDELLDGATELLKYYEDMTGIIGGLNLGYIKLAISIHGFDNVKMAINKALELNKDNTNYINGILKNWKREGYPSDDKNYKSRVTKNSSNLKFDNFEARKYDYDSLEKRLLGWEGEL